MNLCRLFVFAAASWTAAAAELPPAATRPVDFTRDVQPLFARHCYSCHGPEKQKGQLRLDRKADALKGGDSHAPDILPGRSAESPLIRFVAGLEKDLLMPPKGERLSTEQISLLRAWIDQGAKWPEDGSGTSAKHWAWQPVVRPAVPEIGNPIDAFLAAKLAEKGLAFSPPADARTLIRRSGFSRYCETCARRVKPRHEQSK